MQPNLEENKVFIHEFSRTAPVYVLLDHFFFYLMSGQHGGRSEEKFLGNVECFFLVVISSLKA